MLDPLIVARAVHFGATAILTGVVFFDLAVARPVLARRAESSKQFVRSAIRATWWALALTFLSGAAWALLLAIKIGDAPAAKVLSGDTLPLLMTQTRFGQVWIVRGVLIAAIAVLTRYASKSWLSLAAAVLLLASTALIGHAGARSDSLGWLQLGADMAHLLAAGFWLGGLPALALVLARTWRSSIGPTGATAIIKRFSMFGIVAVGLLLVTGIVNTWLLTDRVLTLPDTAYGRLLLIKIGLFVVMVAFASINRWYWSARLPALRAIAVIRRNALVELGLGLLVICIVGALGTLPPPLHQHVHSEDKSPDAAFVHIHDVTAMADVTVLPGRPGPSEIWVQLMKEDFTPLPARAVRVRLMHPGQQTIEAEGRSGRVGVWRVPGIDLPAAGVWTIVVQVQTDSGAVTLDAPFVLEAAGSAQKQ